MFGYRIKFDYDEMIEYEGFGQPPSASAMTDEFASPRPGDASGFNIKYDKLIKNFVAPTQ